MNISLLTDCTEADFRQIEALIGVLSSSCTASMDIIRELLSHEGTRIFVARNTDNCIVGMATVCCFTIPTGRHATIEDVVVMPECQGTGLGRQLVQAILDHLRSTGLSFKVGLTSKPARVAANGLYRSMGFKQKQTNVYTMDI